MLFTLDQIATFFPLGLNFTISQRQHQNKKAGTANEKEFLLNQTERVHTDGHDHHDEQDGHDDHDTLHPGGDGKREGVPLEPAPSAAGSREDTGGWKITWPSPYSRIIVN